MWAMNGFNTGQPGLVDQAEVAARLRRHSLWPAVDLPQPGGAFTTVPQATACLSDEGTRNMEQLEAGSGGLDTTGFQLVSVKPLQGYAVEYTVDTNTALNPNQGRLGIRGQGVLGKSRRETDS
mmetsp:Transcript_35289/g.99905  ORF Transcript_35289/g.99905 Transcript_35289/m.99905 type:complete len:123 (-) Transcript_35289:132-500(-)